MTSTANVPVVQLEELAAHPLELLGPTATIPDLRASPAPALALLVATPLDEALTPQARWIWQSSLSHEAASFERPLDAIGAAFRELESSPFLGVGPYAPANTLFEAAVMDSAGDFGAIAGVPRGEHPQRFAESVLRSEATLALYGNGPIAADAGTGSSTAAGGAAAPRVAVAMIVRAATGELAAAVETVAPRTFPVTVGAAALPGGALHVEDGVAVIVLGDDPWFAREGFARKLHARHVASGGDPAASLEWARQRLLERDPLAIALVTRQRHAVWTSVKAFSEERLWALPEPSVADRAPDSVVTGPAVASTADAGAEAADAGAVRERTP